MNKIIQLVDSKAYGLLALSSDGAVYTLADFKGEMIWTEWLPTIEGSDDIIDLLGKETK